MREYSVKVTAQQTAQHGWGGDKEDEKSKEECGEVGKRTAAGWLVDSIFVWLKLLISGFPATD